MEDNFTNWDYIPVVGYILGIGSVCDGVWGFVGMEELE